MSREVMQQALEALERYQVKRQDFDRFADEIAALRAALAEPAAPQGEPVARVVLTETLGLPCLQWLDLDRQFDFKGGELLYAAPPAAPIITYGPPAERAESWPNADLPPDIAAEITRRLPELFEDDTPPAAPSVPASQWIACSEQLPDADIEVLAFADEAMYLAVYEPDGWWSACRGYMLHRVTHWMDLPEAPSGEGA
jgi:hypothetical protein